MMYVWATMAAKTRKLRIYFSNKKSVQKLHYIVKAYVFVLCGFMLRLFHYCQCYDQSWSQNGAT